MSGAGQQVGRGHAAERLSRTAAQRTDRVDSREGQRCTGTTDDATVVGDQLNDRVVREPSG